MQHPASTHKKIGFFALVPPSCGQSVGFGSSNDYVISGCKNNDDMI